MIIHIKYNKTSLTLGSLDFYCRTPVLFHTDVATVPDRHGTWAFTLGYTLFGATWHGIVTSFCTSATTGVVYLSTGAFRDHIRDDYGNWGNNV